MSESSTGYAPTLPFASRADLQVSFVAYRDESCAIIKDPVRLKYFRLAPEQYFVLELLRTPHSMDQLKQSLQRSFPTIHVEVVELQTLLQDLHKNGLLVSNRLGQGVRGILKKGEENRKKILQFLANPLFFRFPGWDPDWFLGLLNRWLGWIFSWPAVFIALSTILGCLVFSFDHYGELSRKVPSVEQFFVGENLMYLWLSITITKFVHEMGHGISVKRFGGECRQMGLTFLVFSPTLYCDTSDSWRFPDKWHRMAVGAAGMYFELILAAVCVVIWWHAPAGAIKNMCLNIFFVSTISTLLFNANPLLKFDGYYILSDYLEIPNLQTKATESLRRFLAWNCFGIKVPESAFVPRTGKAYFATYAVLAFFYRWVVMIGIISFMYNVLKPYRLESIGLTITSISIVGGMIVQAKQWREIFIAPRKKPMSRVKISISLALLIGSLLAISFIPVPWYVEASVYIEPSDARKIYATVPGILKAIDVQPGQRVQKGDVIAALENDELVNRVDEIRTELAIATQKFDVARIVDDEAAMKSARDRVTSLSRELEEAELWLRQTVITAPVDGFVVEAPVQMQGKSHSDKQLSKWTGSLLSKRNLGALVEPQTYVCMIAPKETLELQIYLDQEHAKEISADREIRVKFDANPLTVIDGIVEIVGEQAIEECPQELYSPFGGALTGRATQDGQLLLERAMIKARSTILDSDGRLAGYRGKARIFVREYSLAQWLWRWGATKIWFRFR